MLFTLVHKTPCFHREFVRRAADDQCARPSV